MSLLVDQRQAPLAAAPVRWRRRRHSLPLRRRRLLSLWRRKPPMRRRLLPVRGVMSLIDLSENQVLQLVESGGLRWAFNVALNPGRTRKELRLLPACVEDFLARVDCALEWPEVLSEIIPWQNPEISAAEVERALNVSGTLIYELIRRKELKACSEALIGRRGSSMVVTQSVIDFLKRRCWPVPMTDLSTTDEHG